ncbi:P-type conjugative transfer protein TrbJ [Skermanella aerolata]|uniref:NosD domain-containing protein n=1 Tax=Skermanella aerolata TaxID=393310 RepID=UPI003D1F8E94
MKLSIFASTALASTFLVSSALAELSDSSQGRTLAVYEGDSIQAALNKARPGDTVSVHRGTYRESVYARVSGVKLMSADGKGAAHIISNGTPLFFQGGANNEIRGFALTAGNGGNGLQVGGTVSDFARGYVIADNVVKNAGLDGLKVHQASGFVFTGNIIENAGTGDGGNFDGGIDFVAVTGSKLVGNSVVRTGGNSCLMLKGGSANNIVSGNTFSGCRDAIHVGGLTGAQWMAPGAGGKEAYGNNIRANTLCGTNSAVYLFAGEAQRQDNAIGGNTIQQGGCSSQVAGGSDSETTVTEGEGGNSTGSFSEGGYVQHVSSQVGGMDICTAGEMASAAAAAAGAAISITGRATAPLQIAQQIMLIFQGRCAAEQLTAQTTMLKGVSMNSLPQVVAAMTQVMNALGTQQSTTYDLAQAERNWVRHFRDATGLEGLPYELTAPEIAKYYVGMRTRSADSMQEAARVRAAAVQAMKVNQRATQQAVAASQSSEGIRGVIQAGNQILGTAVNQLQETTTTMVAYQEAQARIQEEDRMGVVLARILHEANIASMGGQGRALGRTETTGEIMGITGPIKLPKQVPSYPTPSQVTAGKLF